MKLEKLIGKRVDSKGRGPGTVVDAIDNQRIVIRFDRNENQQKSFLYPKCFIEGFTLLDEQLSVELSNDLVNWKAAIKEKEWESKREYKYEPLRETSWYIDSLKKKYGEFDNYLDLSLRLHGVDAFNEYNSLTLEEKIKYLNSKDVALKEYEGWYSPNFDCIVIDGLINPFTEEPYIFSLEKMDLAYKKRFLKERLYQKEGQQRYYASIVSFRINSHSDSANDLFSLGIKKIGDLPEECNPAINNKESFFYRKKPSPEKSDISEDIIHDINAAHFLTRTNIPLCVNDNHILEDIYGRVEVIDSQGQHSKVLFIGAYCKICDAYFMLESEYKRIKKIGKILCKTVERNYWRTKNDESYSALNPESKLHQYGYNVSASQNMTQFERVSILNMLIKDKIMTRYEIISFLNILVNMNKNKSSYRDAVKKWKDDIRYLEKYDDNIRVVDVESIERNKYNLKKS